MDTIDRIDEFADRFDEWMKRNIIKIILAVAAIFTALEVGKSYWVRG